MVWIRQSQQIKLQKKLFLDSNWKLYITIFIKFKILKITLNLVALMQNINLPYMVNGTIKINYLATSNYSNLLNQYDPSLLKTLLPINEQMLQEPVYQFDILMEPQYIRWMIWKNSEEINQFIASFADYLEDKINIKSVYNNFKDVSVDARNVQVFSHLLNLIATDLYLRKTEEFLLFIEHCVSIDKWGMLIYKQMEIEKEPNLFNKFTNMFSSNTKKERDFFITITEDGILKSDNHLLESRITFMIPFTNQLTIQCKQSQQKYISYIIQSCAHEQLTINFFNHYKKAINFIVGIKIALDKSTYSNPNHRFNSFCPIRANCASKLYVDGAEYYQDMYEQLTSAKKQVCITGWMITPYFLLKRPNSIDQKQFRLDGVLQNLAQRGIKVYIIVFMEPKMVVNNDSQHVQQYLQSLHDNIKVYRHPNGAIPLLWSHHEKMVIIDQQVGFMGGLDICYGRWDFHQHLLNDPGLLWDGADYNNYRSKDICEPRKYKQSNLNKQFQVRMPWHDIALQFRGDVVLDLLRHFVQYWYFVKSELLVDPFKALGFFKKRYEQAFNNAFNKNQKQEAQYYNVEIKKRQEVLTLGQKMKYMINGRQQRFPQLFIEVRSGKKVGNQSLQMCRSASEWSIGVRPGQHESSIHNAYQALIQQSEKHIYIQNQFFMGLQNKVVQCLADRIIKAHNNNQNFKVIVVMPLLPGFEGDIADPASTVLRIQVHHQYQAILRNKQKSLKSRLDSKNVPMDKYIRFFGLRASEIVGNWPKTEIIYVHSKLMIVDDKRCIIGSANINDRSLLGTRDSELACVIEQNQGNIFNLRSRIFQEHFGLTDRQSGQFPSEQIWNKIIGNCKRSTQFYRKFFRCIPDDFVTTRFEVQIFQKQLEDEKNKYNQPEQFAKTFIQHYNREKSQIKWHAVEFPLKFMQNEDLNIRMNQKQFYAPEISFT